MSDDKTTRARRIEDAAYKVLAEKGFKGASMLAVARAAKASNETLYNWYGDKVGLFAALVQSNAAQVAERLETVRKNGGRGLDALEAVSCELLTMLTGERAVSLNRAAAADVSGVLGLALAKGGRETVAPLLSALLAEAQEDGNLRTIDLKEISETFIALLIGDLQIRRATGVLPALTQKEATARTKRAVTQLKQLYSD